MKFEIGHLYQKLFDGLESGLCRFNITTGDVCSVGLLYYYSD